MNTPTDTKTAQALAARFCAPATPPTSTKPVTGANRWPRVRELMKDGPLTYRKLARRMKLTPKHANTLLHRYAERGLVLVVTKGRKGYAGPASVFGLPGGGK